MCIDPDIEKQVPRLDRAREKLKYPQFTQPELLLLTNLHHPSADLNNAIFYGKLDTVTQNSLAICLRFVHGLGHPI